MKYFKLDLTYISKKIQKKREKFTSSRSNLFSSSKALRRGDNYSELTNNSCILFA